MKIKKVKNYKINITPHIEREILDNAYYRYNGIDTIQLNQCPICEHTNINRDPWIMACVGSSHLYLYPNKRAKSFYKNRKYIGIPDYSVSTESWLKRETYKQHPEMHEPIEMAQEIISKDEAEKRFND